MPTSNLLDTTVMGSYPQPNWLVDRRVLVREGVPRSKANNIWRLGGEDLAEAIEAATLVAIADQEAAGIDIITDGEVGRESYFNHFANSLSGVDPDEIGQGINRNGGISKIPLVNGPIERLQPVELDAARFLRAHTDRRTKVTIPGPFTLSQLAQNEHYPDQASLAAAYAVAINAELRDLEAAGIDVLQLDEPYLQANAEAASEFAIEVIAAAVDGISATTTLHTCYGYSIYVQDKSTGYPFLDELADAPVDFVAIESAEPNLDPAVVARLAPRGVTLGVIDLGRTTVETPDEIATRVRAALEHISPDKLTLAPDCGMKFLPRALAQAKLAALAAGVAQVRADL
ncbi:MAG: 5-methyltetrahydropteroyltriglutamate--homocysteine methyltransferase [Acidimicrobiales bacterium]